MSLYQYEREGDVDGLLGFLKGGGTPAVRARAAELLGEFEPEDRIVDALVGAVREEESREVTAAAVDALDELGEGAIESLLADATSVDPGDADWVRAEAYAGALSADLPELRMAAANALGRLGNPDAVPSLVGRLDDPDSRVRARAARACGKIGDPRAVDPLIGALDDEEAAVRREAAYALGAIGTPEALARLRDMLDDDSEAIRRIAVDALGESSRGEPVDDLVAALGDESALVRRGALFSVIQLLSNVPAERSHEIRETVVERLTRTDDESVLEPLVEILDEGQGGTQRRNAAWLLGRVTSEPREDVIRALVDALGDDDTMTAQFAATSLATIGGEPVEDALLDVVDSDAGSEARAKAAFALGKAGGDRARERLDRLIDDEDDEEVRKQAFSALSKLGGRA